MQAWVTRTSASVGSAMAASGTSSTRMSRGPWYTLALMPGPPARGAVRAAYGEAAGRAREDYAVAMDPEAPRRRPRPLPPASPEPPGAAPAGEDAPRRGRIDPFGVVWWGALAAVLAVIVIAFGTGTADDLPWGAIIGVVAVLAFAWVVGRRRAALRRQDDDEEEDGGP